MLKIEGLHTYYGNIHALKGIDMDIGEGEIVSLIGSNGAGKSTTLNTVAGLIHAAQGKIVFRGSDITNMPAHKLVGQGMSLSPEGREVFAALTVQENLQLGAFSKRDRGAVEASFQRVYDLFPRLKERVGQQAGTLSGGEQQMLAMGRALMSSPTLLMLDEPSMGLAPILVDQIFDIIQSLHKAGTTILLVEQNAQMALSVADRGYVLETGKIVTSGTGAELLNDESVKKAYLGG